MPDDSKQNAHSEDSHTGEEEPSHEAMRREYQLNWLGTAVFMGGWAIRSAAKLVDHVAVETGKTLAEAERAFYDELDPEKEDAVILEERDKEDR